MEKLLETIEVETGKNPTAAIIWMHGLGADANDFVPIVGELGLDSAPAVRFVFPNAPMRPVTINNGYVMRAWYDVSFGDLEGKSRRADEIGVRESQAQIGALIEREISRGISSKNILLAGFSQGGAIALHTTLRYPKPLAGVMALSTYLPLAESLAQEGTPGEQARADLHGARRVRPGRAARDGRGLDDFPDRPGLRRRLAPVPDAALGVRAGDRGHRRLAA